MNGASLRRHNPFRLAGAGLGALAWTSFAPAIGLAQDIHGRVELQEVFAANRAQSLDSAFDERDLNDVLGDVRLTWGAHKGAWDFVIHDELGADAGDTPFLVQREDAIGVFPPLPPANLLDLTQNLVGQPHFSLKNRIDRLSVGYTSARIVVRIGRQALTWGAGLVFRPMDLFDPFAPDATDVEYKPGTDMLYGQYLFDDGSDLQLVIVPRADRLSNPPDSNESSYALHYHVPLGALQTTWLAARDHGDWVGGMGLNGPLAGATWNAEIVPTIVRDGGTYVSLIANISDAITLADRDATLFAEYYRNGFGLAARGYAYDGLPAPLKDRLLRGQVFDTGRDYVAAGGMLQATPLLQINPTEIVNLDDASLYGLVQATYSLRENLNLIAGVEIPEGPARTEFGGIPLSGSARLHIGPSTRLYVQLRRYF